MLRNMDGISIMQVCISASWGGLEMHVPILARSLARKGYPVTAVCRRGSPIDDRLVREGIPRLAVKGEGYISPGSVLAIRDFAGKHRVRLVHTHYSRDLWRVVPAIAPMREIAHVHTRHIRSGVVKRDFLHRLLFRRVDGWIVTSEDGRVNLLDTHPVDPRKVHLVSYGVDLSGNERDPYARERIRKEFGISGEVTVVGMLGRLTPGKGHMTLFQAARKVLSETDRAVVFLIIGGPSRGEEGFGESLKKAVAGMGLEGWFRFAGQREDVWDILSAMDIYVMPSDKEAFGISLLEARGSGLPVITTAAGGPQEVVEDGRSGILIPPRDPDRLSEAILRLYRDEGLRRRLGEAARERVMKRYSEEAMVEGILEVYRSVIGRRRRGAGL